MMKNNSKSFLLAITVIMTAAFAGNASAALFDTMDSVDTLQKIADTKRVNTDRMPAGKVTTDASTTETSKTDESAAKKTKDAN